jgi:glycogen/starch synthases, ADP-glucose type
MQVLAVTPEIYPLIKTGGLADVTGALPLALAECGVSTRTLIPGYPTILQQCAPTTPVLAYGDLQGGEATVYPASAAGLDLLVLHAPHLFERPGGPYVDSGGRDWSDNWRRFAALSRVGADIAAGAMANWRPDVVHVHDWQAALTPAYMRYGEASSVPSVITVHNIAFQGHFGAQIFPSLGLPSFAMALDGVEYYGGVGYLKAGLQSAWALTTVSPTYAREITTPQFGMGLEGLIRSRAEDLHGIVNGIDTDVWNPATDHHLTATFTADALEAREANRLVVEKRFGLRHDASPLFCVVSRLTWQKGMDILASVVDELVASGARLAVLGSGDAHLEGSLLAAAARHPGAVGVVIGYDEALSHLMQGGCDAICIPSRFEPCGLTQLYGLRYGCVPLVARTGGLADTVIDANEAALSAGVATGFQFSPESGDALSYAIKRAIELHADHKAWIAIQKQGMRADVSWHRSAEKYAALYKELLARKAA